MSEPRGDTRAEALQLDAADPLAEYRLRFLIPDEALVYLDGNSLGRTPAATVGAVDKVVQQQWATRLIRSWDEGWFEGPLEVGDRLGAAMLGAGPGETIVCDTVTLNTYKLLHAALDMRPGRPTIVANRNDFPTDRYIASEVAQQRGSDVRWLGPLDPNAPVPIEPMSAAYVIGALRDDVGVVLLSVVDYRTGALADVAGITAAVHAAGALMIWDCSHSGGVVPMDLPGIGADLAVGCTYKFICGGPGAPAWAWVRADLQDAIRNPVPGWMGHDDVFDMPRDYVPAKGIRRLMTGTPSALTLAGVDEGVRLIAEAGIDRIRAKSELLTAYAIDLCDQWLVPRGVTLGSPRQASARGSHITVHHSEARALTQALTDRGVIPDFRTPDGIRIGLSPLTTRFTDVYDGLAALRDLLDALETVPPTPSAQHHGLF